MDLEDLFKIRRRFQHDGHHHDARTRDEHHDDHHKHDYSHHDGYKQHHGVYYKIELMRSIIGALQHNKALFAAFIVGLVLVILAGAALLLFLLPLAGKATAVVSQNGIQGLLGSISEIAQRLWQGKG